MVEVGQDYQQPSQLELMAWQQGTSPVELLRSVLSRHSRLRDAAAEFGVSRVTLNKWRRKHTVEVTREL